MATITFAGITTATRIGGELPTNIAEMADGSIEVVLNSITISGRPTDEVQAELVLGTALPSVMSVVAIHREINRIKAFNAAVVRISEAEMDALGERFIDLYSAREIRMEQLAV